MKMCSARRCCPWSERPLKERRRGALRAAVRGLGPARRAARLRLGELGDRAADQQDEALDAPRDYGAFVVVGVWWLLREVECSALRVASVLDGAAAGGAAGVVSLTLGATTSTAASTSASVPISSQASAHE